MKPSTNQTNEAQYLMDYLDRLELMITGHCQNAYLKKYLVYRDGYLSFGTDDFGDVQRLLRNTQVKFSYKENQSLSAGSRAN